MRELIPTERDLYISSLISHKPSPLSKIESELKTDGKWGINLGDNESQILWWLLKILQPKKCIEIGTQYGYSATWMLDALPAESYLWTLEKDIQHAEKAKENLEKVHKNCKVVVGEALKNLVPLSQKGPFDFIFIDADKSTYVDYLRWARQNLRPGGLLVADNVWVWGAAFYPEYHKGLNASETQWKKMREFNRELVDCAEFDVTFLPTEEGMALAIKK